MATRTAKDDKRRDPFKTQTIASWQWEDQKINLHLQKTSTTLQSIYTIGLGEFLQIVTGPWHFEVGDHAEPSLPVPDWET